MFLVPLVQVKNLIYDIVSFLQMKSSVLFYILVINLLKAAKLSTWQKHFFYCTGKAKKKKKHGFIS